MRSLGGVALLVLAVWCALVAHEVGHLAAGLVMGWRVGVVAVGPLWLGQQEGRLRLRWNRLLATWGGIAMVYPRDERSFAAKATLVAAGGPMASLFVAMVAYAVGNIGPHATRFAGPARAMSIMSLAVLAATAQPFGTGLGGPSDGGRVLMFFRARAQAEAWAAVWPLIGMSMAKERPRDWQTGFVRLAEAVVEPPGPALEVRTYLLRYWLDRNDVRRAAKVIDEMVALFDAAPKMFRADAAAEIAFYRAYFCRDPARAEHYLARAAGAEAHRLARAEAAVRMRSSDHAGAEAALRRARKALADPQLESTDLDTELVDAVQAELCGGATGAKG